MLFAFGRKMKQRTTTMAYSGIQPITRRMIFILLAFSLAMPLYSQLPTAADVAKKMKLGWNLGNSLEVPGGETGWGNPKVSQVLITAVRNAGFNTIRIPCSWNSHANASTMVIDTAWLGRVREVIDYCYANDMYVLLNCHWDGGWLENNVTEAMKDSVNKKQRAYWTQVANYFKDYDEHLLFAGANEPNASNATQMAVLMTYHQTFIDAVRLTGGNNSSRILVVQGPNTDIETTNNLMSTMPVDQISDRLMVEVHYYTPWQFCGLETDANWGKMFYFWGSGYHSTTNTSRNATWGEENTVESFYQMMKTKFVDKGIPMILGEYSAMKRTTLTGADLTLHIASREYFLQYVTNAALRYGMIPMYWDNGYSGTNGIALFNRSTGSVVDQGSLDAILRGGAITGVEEQHSSANSAIDYLTATPNPVTSSGEVTVTLRTDAHAEISVYNILGQRVARFQDLPATSGRRIFMWNPGGLSTGTYFVVALADRRVLSEKILLVK
jgi:endoglucanase